MKRLFPTSAYNFVSLLGVALAFFGLAAIVILYLLDAFSSRSNPYLGMFIFIAFPGVLVLGLLLIPLGMWREHRFGKRREQKTFLLDLGNASHRNALVTFIAGTCIFLLLTTVGLYEGYHYAESVEFCGEVCHQVMAPEHTAYFNSPHAEVACVSCHIGPGADWYFKSKLSGARQVWKAVTNTYESPIPVPVKDMRPADEVCQHCHWSDQSFDATQVTNQYFLGDSLNTPWEITMAVNVGGTRSKKGSKAIHWHVKDANRITYLASDSSRSGFDRVVLQQDGNPRVFTPGGKPIPETILARGQKLGLERTMDCLDCHNRPAHQYRSPMKAVNEALSQGALDPNIPWIKRQAVRMLSRVYETREGGLDSIAAGLQAFYKGEGIDISPQAIVAVQNIFKQNMFPEMKVRWEEYPEHNSHLNFPGCFRCHGSNLKTEDGDEISADCNLCHTIAVQGPVKDPTGSIFSSTLDFRHPIDIDGADEEIACYDCHIGDESVYLKTKDGKEISGQGHASGP